MAASAQRTLYGAVLANRLGLHQSDLECLFIITLGLNILALYIVRKYREQYE